MNSNREKKSKIFHYKSAESNNGSDDFQGLLKKAIEENSKVKNRVQVLGEADSQIKQFLNYHETKNKMLFGNFVMYEPGKNSHIIKVEDLDVETLPVEQLAPNSEKGKKQEFLDSILYFGILKNHVVLLQSKGLNSRDFQNYLNWLLQKTGDSEEKEFIVFRDKVNPKTKKKVMGIPINQISFGLDVDTGDLKNKETIDQKTENIKGLKGQVGAKILKYLIEHFNIKNKSIQEALNGPDIRINLEIKYPSLKKSDNGKFLEEMAGLVNDFYPNDFKAKIKGVGVIKGSELKVFGPCSVSHVGGQVEPSDLFPQMYKWLKAKIESQDIDP